MRRSDGLFYKSFDLALPVFPSAHLLLFSCLLLMAVGGNVRAQGYPSEQGRFTVSQIRGCAPLTVEITSEDIPPGNTNPSIFAFNYGGNINGTINFNRDQDYRDTTYAIPGTYKILWILGSPIDSITIEVLEPRPPQFRVYTCINNSILIERTGSYYDRLQIDLGDGITIETSASETVYPMRPPAPIPSPSAACSTTPIRSFAP